MAALQYTPPRNCSSVLIVCLSSIVCFVKTFNSFRGPLGLTKEILRQEGVRGLFKGLTATFMREMPGYFFFFGGYEASRHLLTPEGKNKDEIGNAKKNYFMDSLMYLIVIAL